MTLLETVTEVLSRRVATWTDQDWKIVDEGNRKLGREQVKDIAMRVNPDDHAD